MLRLVRNMLWSKSSIFCMSGMFITDGMSRYSFDVASFNSVMPISIDAGCSFDSDELLISRASATRSGGIWLYTFTATLMFDALAEACHTERLTPITDALAGRGMTDCAGSSKGRLPLDLVAISVLDVTFALAFCVAFLPIFLSLSFSAGSSSSLELVVKHPLELDDVTAFCCTAFPISWPFLIFHDSPLPVLFPSPFKAILSLTPCVGLGDGVLCTTHALRLTHLIISVKG